MFALLLNIAMHSVQNQTIYHIAFWLHLQGPQNDSFALRDRKNFKLF